MKQSLFVVLFLAFTSFSAKAIEADQYLSSFEEIQDSSAAINDYIHQSMDRALKRFNDRRRGADRCQDLASEVFTQMVGRFSISKISQFAATSPDVDRFPNLDVDMKEYFNISIYQDAKFPINMVGLGRTINIGGVYVSTDKLGHFALLGRNYYNRYKRYAKRWGEEKATVKTIEKGIRQEIVFLGYVLGGVLSFADLEANFQGLRFGKEMCQGDTPYLLYNVANSAWVKNPARTFDVKNYFNPKMDETYNQNFWRPNLWKKVKDKVKESYCQLLQTESYVNRLQFYASLVEENKNDEVIRDFISNKPKYDRSVQTIICD